MGYRINCPKCGILLEVQEDPGSGPGGKDRETANCPNCRCEVASEMTEGLLYAYKVGPDGKVVR